MLPLLKLFQINVFVPTENNRSANELTYNKFNKINACEVWRTDINQVKISIV